MMDLRVYLIDEGSENRGWLGGFFWRWQDGEG